MWQIVCFFVALILLLVGIWLFANAASASDPTTQSQKKTWAFVVLIFGFFLLLLAAACPMKGQGYKSMKSMGSM